MGVILDGISVFMFTHNGDAETGTLPVCCQQPFSVCATTSTRLRSPWEVSTAERCFSDHVPILFELYIEQFSGETVCNERRKKKKWKNKS